MTNSTINNATGMKSWADYTRQSALSEEEMKEINVLLDNSPLIIEVAGLIDHKMHLYIKRRNEELC